MLLLLIQSKYLSEPLLKMTDNLMWILVNLILHLLQLVAGNKTECPNISTVPPIGNQHLIVIANNGLHAAENLELIVSDSGRFQSAVK